MTASTSVHSNALNFMGYMRNGVDPRTGQYTLSVSLPELAANELRGPQLPLRLAYNPLNTLDSGFGLGWDLQLSQYQPGSQVISVGGESFKITGSGDQGRLLMKEQKIESFRLYDLGDGRYRLAHKAGQVEMLEVRGAGNARAAVPVQVLAASGHAIHLDYDSFDGHPLLKSILDDNGETLLRIIRHSHEVEILLRPYAGDAGGPLARWVMTLQGSDHQVSRIALPTAEPASWRFTYSDINGHLRLSTVYTPTGAQEDIYYRDGGHVFPVQSQRTPLPRVTRHVLHPGAGQPASDVRYSYGHDQHNFLGAGLPIAWADDGLDNLYRHNQPYEYQSSETLYVDDQPVREVQRRFNRFHLLTEETTLAGRCRKTVSTTYHEREGLAFDQQPNQCQLPSAVKTTWSLSDDATRVRSEQVSSRFDEYGNLVHQQQANGLAESLQWYPADGSEDGCPADPEGFVRHLKSKTRHPAPGAGDAPVTCERHRYLSLTPLHGSGQPQWLAPESETLELPGQDGAPASVLQATVFDYLHSPADAFMHGRMHRQTRTLGGLATITEHAWSKPQDAPGGQPVVQVSDTTHGFDGTCRTLLRQDSLYSGQTLLTLIDDVQTQYRYDALDRVLEERVSPDTVFEATRHYHYALCDSPGQQAEQRVIDARQVTTRSLLDGLGRAVHEERDQLDEQAPWAGQTLYTARYDAWHRLIEETHHDSLDGQPLALCERYAYDEWGEQCCLTDPQGVEQHRETDPIGTPESAGPIIRSWTQATGDDGAISGLSETWMNLFGKPSREIRLDSARQALSQVSYSYDGLGRCIESRDEYGEVTGYRYDAWSRLTENQLPDGSLVVREYAPHSSEERVSSIAVQDPGGQHIAVGKQVFDGLQRLSRLQVGTRSESYSYQGGRLQVEQRRTAAGAQIAYEYNLQLTDQPTTMSVLDSHEAASFAYDPVSARLTSASNTQGQRAYAYDAHNRLRSEDWSDAQARRWQTRYALSWQGLPLNTQGPAQAGSSGVETRRGYDPFGRLETLTQGALHVTFEYDGLGQPARIVTRDRDSGSQLSTCLEHDHQGREVRRRFSLDQQPEQVIEQRWRLDDLLENRHWQQDGNTLLNEDFEYDARGRLSKHSCSGTQLPRDELGRPLASQLFVFDALDNLTTVLSRFADGQSERVRLSYDPDSPCQLTGLSYTPARAQGDPSFSYDADGNQLNDQQGRQLGFDALGRLLQVSAPGGQLLGRYAYDSHDQLVTSQQADSGAALRFYQGERISSLVRDGVQTHWLSGIDNEQPLAQHSVGEASETLLLLCDANHSVRGEADHGRLRQAVYSAYGERYADTPLAAALGFNGELLDPASDWYLLGKGYRAYNPALMRFLSPDSLSPFGAGGLNPYCYCLGNPIALRDPTGHQGIGFSGRLRTDHSAETWGSGGGGGGGILAWVFVGLGAIGTVAAVAAAVASFGLLTPVAVAAAEGTAAATGAAVGAAVGATAASGATAGTSVSGALAFTALSASAALSAGSTIASGISAATGNEMAGEWGQYLGIGAAATGILGSGAYSMASSAAKAARAAGQSSTAVGGGVLRSGAGAVARNSLDDIALRLFERAAVSPIPRARIPASPLAGEPAIPSWLAKHGGRLIPTLPKGAPRLYLPRITTLDPLTTRGFLIRR